MDVLMLVVVFALGSAALAGWSYARFPQLAPTSLRGAIVHICAALLFTQLSAVPLQGASADTEQLFVMLFGLALPSLVYSFLAALWVIRICQEMMGRAIR